MAVNQYVSLEAMTNNLTWKNKGLPIYTSFLVIVVDAFLSCWEKLNSKKGKTISVNGRN